MIDRVDRRILEVVQVNATISLAELSERVGLSQTPCWKRLKRLEAEGYICRRVALLNRQKLGVGVTVFVMVRTNQHDEEWLQNFATEIGKIPEVVEFYRMSGEVDYLLKVVCSGIEDYDRIYRTLIRAAKLYDVSSSFAMEQIKYTTDIPIPPV